jgi:hypothetical protein
VIGLLIGLGFGWWAWIMYDSHRHMVASGVTTEGTMTGGYRETRTTRRGATTSVTYSPAFRYRTADGRTVEGIVEETMDRGEIRPGRALAVMYDPANPTTVRLASAVGEGPGRAPWVLGGLALLFALPCAYALATGRAL